MATWGTQNGYFPGSTALFSNTGNPVTLSQVGGGTFTLSSIDLADIYNQGNPSYQGSSGTVNFTGIRADNSTVTQSFTTDLLPGLETFTFSNFNNLVSVSWDRSGLLEQFDNINVSSTSTAAVPEPFTAIGTLIGGTAAVRMRKKLKSAK